MKKQKSEFIFVPLGGTGEIGKNMNLYGYEGKWLMVDLGITFGDQFTPGFDIIMPDPTFITERKKDLVGVVITHAHEDHVGAVPYLWPELECPIYASPFTVSVIKRKLADVGVKADHLIHTIPLDGRQKIGPFEIELVCLTHSIPEPNALVIRTEGGSVFHTGDWKIDPEPLVGDVIDTNVMHRIGEEGIDALVCDSTNALEDGKTGSEAEVRAALIDMVAQYDNRVIISCFSSNIARLETIAKVAEASGRKPSLSGRSLWRMLEIAQENGYLEGVEFIPETKINSYPRDKILVGCTGSQGESRAALSRIANMSHPNVKLQSGDVVILSSRVIPGNEKSIAHLHNSLIRLGVEVITSKHSSNVHVSGHPARDELTQMYQWIKPRVAIPVHGEHRHLVAQADLAKQLQVPEVIVANNGSVVKINPGKAEILDEVNWGRWALDGRQIVPLTKPLLRKRERVIKQGYVVITIAIDHKGKIRGDVQLNAFGIWEHDPNDDDWWSGIELIRDAVESMPGKKVGDDKSVAKTVESRLNSYLKDQFGKRPIVEVNIIRL
jgi:ribonuclease J